MTTWTKETINLAIATDSLSVDDIRIDGSYIGHASDIDLLTLSSGELLVRGTIEATGTITGNVTGTILTAAQTNITSVGTLSSLATSGNVTVGGDLAISGGNITTAIICDSTVTTTGLLTATAGLKLGNNIIYASDGGTAITLDTDSKVTFADDIKVASDKKIYLDGGTSEALVYDSGTDTIRLYTGGAGHYTTLTSPYSENSNTVYGKNAGAGMHASNVNNTFIGDDTASTGTMTAAATNNTGIGFGALQNITLGSKNTAVGQGALNDLTEGNQNTAVGRDALSVLTTGLYNTAFGYHAGYANLTDHKNVYVGRNSGASFRSSGGDTNTYNTAIGSYAAEHWTTGVKNTLIGAEAGNGRGNPVTGSDNILIGWHADPSGDATDNEIVIGTNATGVGANKIKIGNASHTDTVLSTSLWVQGNFACNGETPAAPPNWSIVNQSDDRAVAGNATDTATVANELATLVKDLIAIGILS